MSLTRGVVPLVVLTIGSGCGGSGHDDGTAAKTWPDASACGTLPNLNNPVMGSISGSNLNAVICPNGEWAYVEQTPIGRGPFYFKIAGAGSFTDVAFQGPAGAFGGDVDAFIGLNAPIAGTYTGPGGSALEWVDFNYWLPPPAGVHCEPTGPLGCSPGCDRICPVSGCGSIPCAPETPFVNYSASAWTLTLSSVGNETDAGLSTPHGTLTATVAEQNGDAGSANLTLTF